MIDPQVYRENPEIIEKALEKRNSEIDLAHIIELDEKRRALIVESENLRRDRNLASKDIAVAKAQDREVDGEIRRMKEIGYRISELQSELETVSKELGERTAELPNIPHESSPVGPDESYNLEIRKWGAPRTFDFKFQSHFELGEKLDIVDLKRAAKIAESRFALMKGPGAAMERALINLMLDTHAKNGYMEIFPPIMVSERSMFATGQLPKLKDEMYSCTDGLYLVPTAEVPVTNIYRDEIVAETQLPIKMAAFTPCFRREAGAAGRDTRGLIRLHQFNKVELVKIVHPDNSFEELEILTLNAENILQLLDLPYRVVSLATGDLSFAASKCYDIEVWLPYYDDYKEISSCSNFTDFQARRGNIKFREEDTGKLRYVHTLNGSGLAIGRTIAAIMENYQNEDGSISVPSALIPYMNGLTKIS